MRLERLHAETLAKGHFGIFSCCGAPWDAKTFSTISLEPLQQQCNVINATTGMENGSPRVGPGYEESASWTHLERGNEEDPRKARKVRLRWGQCPEPKSVEFSLWVLFVSELEKCKTVGLLTVYLSSLWPLHILGILPCGASLCLCGLHVAGGHRVLSLRRKF